MNSPVHITAMTVFHEFMHKFMEVRVSSLRRDSDNIHFMEQRRQGAHIEKVSMQTGERLEMTRKGSSE